MATKRNQDNGPGPVNVKAVVTNHRGVTHRQVFVWSDRNAGAMEDAILAQQKKAERLRSWRCLRIETPLLLDLLGLVRTTLD